MNTELIFADIVVPFMGGVLAGTYARAMTKFLIVLVLLALAGVFIAFVPLHEGTFAAVQSGSREVILAARQIATHVPATALSGFLIGCVIDRLRRAR